MKEILKKNKLIVCSITLAIIVVITTISYAYLSTTITGNKKNIIRAGVLELKLDESLSDGISLLNTYPISDTEGLRLDPYIFTLENTGTIDSNYTIYLKDMDIDDGKVRMDDSVVKYSLEKDGTSSTNLLTTLGTEPNRILDTGIIKKGQKINYKLRVWMDYNADNTYQSTIFSANLKIVGEQITN